MATFMHDYPEQLYAYLELVRAFDNREAAIFFVDDPGGSNKSFLFEAFLHYARGRGEIAASLYLIRLGRHIASRRPYVSRTWPGLPPSAQ